MKRSIDDPVRVRVFGQNVALCAELIHTPMASLARRTGIPVKTLTGFSDGKGVITKRHLTTLASEIGLKDLVLLSTCGDRELRRSVFQKLLSGMDVLTISSTGGSEKMPPTLKRKEIPSK
jgi:hypothetical protein